MQGKQQPAQPRYANHRAPRTRKRHQQDHRSRSGRQNAATRCSTRREERVTVQGPVKKQQPDGMSHRQISCRGRVFSALHAYSAHLSGIISREKAFDHPIESALGAVCAWSVGYLSYHGVQHPANPGKICTVCTICVYQHWTHSCALPTNSFGGSCQKAQSGHTRDPYSEILGAPWGIMVTPSGGFDF